MAEYNDKNRGVAFFNDKKDKETKPDYRGKGNFNGVDFELALWGRTTADGREYYSISFSEPYQKTESKAPSWEAQREKFTKKEEVVTEVSDEPIDLSEIPF
jgi:uncharacterized protein (DUF736 family)